MRISDWSSDVCSSDLPAIDRAAVDEFAGLARTRLPADHHADLAARDRPGVGDRRATDCKHAVADARDRAALFVDNAAEHGGTAGVLATAGLDRDTVGLFARDTFDGAAIDDRAPTEQPYRIVRIAADRAAVRRSDEHTYELTSLMRIPYAVFCL